MSIRSTHKAQLKTILEGITYNTVALPVYDEVATTSDRFPYVFITSGGLTPNRASANAVTLNSTNDYVRQYRYFINLVTQGTEDISGTNLVEIQLDDLEEEIMELLQKDSTRDNVNWTDLYVQDVSSPFSGAELNINETYIIKTFEVVIEYRIVRV